jgi:preprotein translocase subunit SecG
MSILSILLYILFVLAAIVLIVVILLQEGRGGGFGEALGVGGREAFGAGARGINSFTAVVAAVFLVVGLAIHIVNRSASKSSVFDENAPPSVGPTAPGAPGADLPAPPSGN